MLCFGAWVVALPFSSSLRPLQVCSRGTPHYRLGVLGSRQWWRRKATTTASNGDELQGQGPQADEEGEYLQLGGGTTTREDAGGAEGQPTGSSWGSAWGTASDVTSWRNGGAWGWEHRHGWSDGRRWSDNGWRYDQWHLSNEWAGDHCFRARERHGDYQAAPWTRSDYQEQSWWGAPWAHRTHTPGGPGPRPDYSHPPPFPGLGVHFRTWRIATARWAGMSDLNPVRRVDRVLRCPLWDLHTQVQDSIAPADLFGPEGMSHLFRLLDERAGHKIGDENKRCLREALFDHERRKYESLSEFAARRKSQFGKAAAHGLLLPDTAKGTKFLERRPHSERRLGRVLRGGGPRPRGGGRRRRRGGQRLRIIMPPTRGD